MEMTVQVEAEAARGELAKIARGIVPLSRLHRLWGQRVANQARRNARAKGGRRFWRQVARATHLREVSEASATVANEHVAGAQKQFGGTIRPVKGKYLTIPISDEARGKRVAEFVQGGRKVFAFTSTKGNRLLAYMEGEQMNLLYVLKTEVTQAAEPWFPDDAEIAGMGLDEGRRLLNKLGVNRG